MNVAVKGREIVVLGGGLTGLSAGYVLTKADFGVKVFERDSAVGGLSRTIERNGFRFDLGGHRFFTANRTIDEFVKQLMGDELVSVPRKSKIYMRNRYFDYPLKPLNALFGLGIPTTMKIMGDYVTERLKRFVKAPDIVSLEDWVVGNFGRKMFDIYFREYSEKVWGIECSRISADWVAQRIRGLSLAKAVKNAFFRLNGKDLPTLVDRFLYPELGIGRISDRLSEEIRKKNEVFTGARVERISHSGSRIDSITVNVGGSLKVVSGDEFISSIPITSLACKLYPEAPDGPRDAAGKLGFRDLVLVVVMVNRKRVTDQTWIYIPEQGIPFGRIHEPTNWSGKMAPEGKTLLVMEFFSFKGDRAWSETDGNLVRVTVENLEKLGFVKSDEVIGSIVLRIPRAYPLFEVRYKEACG
ncbi:MAG TPA: FAD-dependent oxidoreductase, partial [Thermodesulfovibrionales bacterium]|nr:FAD-dependent oxidoreductase [Thermodesulfovibrionales bacterium]